MKEVEIVVKVTNHDGMSSGCQAKVLVYVSSGIPAKLYVVVPNLDQADRHRFRGVCNHVNRGHAGGFTRRGRYDLQPVDYGFDAVGHRGLMQGSGG